MKTTVPIFPLSVMRRCSTRFLAVGFSIVSITLTIVMALTGCVADDLTTPITTGRVFTVNYSFEGAQTRVAATGAEKEMTDVAVLFYRADDSNPSNETFVDYEQVNIVSGNPSTSFPLPMPGGIVQGSKYKLIIIGNYNKYAPDGKRLGEYTADNSTRTYSRMKQEIQGNLATDEARVVTPLPFWGVLLGADGYETTLTGPAAGDTSLGVSVKFSRAVARFDISNLAADQLRIAWVKVCNYRNRGYFFHEMMPAGNVVRGIASAPPIGDSYPTGYVKAHAPTGEDGSKRQDLTEGGLYAFPNTVAYTAQDDKTTAFLMIAGYYQTVGEPENTTKLTYYRANVSESSGSSQIIRRNYIYSLVINKVRREGAETETAAENEKEKLLEYKVGEDWDSEDNSTAVDGQGNFLTLSRTSVVLESGAGEIAVIRVAVKKNTGWRLDWTNNPNGAFRFEKIDDNSFRILTTGKNDDLYTRNAALNVSVTDVSSNIFLTVNVIQLSSQDTQQMLVVEGKTGSFDYTVPGQGAIIELQTVTGSSSSRWKAEADHALQQMLSKYSESGGNKGSIELIFNGNTTGAPRSGVLTVKRLLVNGTEDPAVAPVYITFQQEKSPFIVNVIPDYSANGLVLDAFSASTLTPNGISRSRSFQVQLADPDNYTYTATCNLNQVSDAVLTTGNAQPTAIAGPLQSSKSNPSTVSGVHNGNFTLSVYRTGPGDKDIRGEIVVTALPKDPTSGLPTGTFTFRVKITSGCNIGDSKIGGVLWADRNTDTMPRGEEGSAIGLNYSNDPKSDDNINSGFRGSYASFAQAPEKCTYFGADMNYEGELATGWRLPTNTEQQAVVPRMCFSKQRAFIVSDDTTLGTVGCWFPLAGATTSPTAVNGYFWSSSPNSTSFGWYLFVQAGAAIAYNSSTQSSGYSVRCVR